MTKEQALDINFLIGNCKRLYFFGLGFIQVKIDEEYRVHFYTNKWQPTATEDEIHNHRYCFESTVVKGKVSQEIYEVATGLSYWKIADNCAPGSMAKAEIEKGFDARLIYRATYAPGSTYYVDSETFHKFFAQDAITLLQRGPVLKEKADILFPRDTQLTCPFSVNVPDVELWAEIGRILRD